MENDINVSITVGKMSFKVCLKAQKTGSLTYVRILKVDI
jgi:hypothetical protein